MTAATFFILPLLAITSCSDLASLFEQGFGLPHSEITLPAPSRIPAHLTNLAPTSTATRYISRRPSAFRVSRYQAEMTFLTSDGLEQGELREVELVLYLRPCPDETTFSVEVEGDVYSFNLSSPTGGPVTLPLTLPTPSLSSVTVRISAHRTLISSSEVQVRTTLTLSRMLNLREKPSLLLHYYQTPNPAAAAARQHFMALAGEAAPHHVNKRSAENGIADSHCSLRDLVINFSDIGLSSVIAPAQFNAHTCSGQCHLDHEEAPMTNHAFLRNLLKWGGEEGVTGARCVAQETEPLTVLVAVGDEYHVMVYEDMVVKSCSCR